MSDTAAVTVGRSLCERVGEQCAGLFDWRPVAVTDAVAVVQGTTVHADRTYSTCR
ncbi:MAG: hypothetical protein ABIM89_06980 [Mycobacteriales bacterium]